MIERTTATPSFKDMYPKLFQNSEANALLDPEKTISDLPQRVQDLQGTSVFIEKQAVRLACGANNKMGPSVDRAIDKAADNNGRERYKDAAFDTLVDTVKAEIARLAVPQQMDALSDEETHSLAEQVVEMQYLRFLAQQLNGDTQVVEKTRASVEAALSAVASWMETQLSNTDSLPSDRTRSEIAAAAAHRYIGSRSSVDTLNRVVTHLQNKKPSLLNKLSLGLETGVMKQALAAELQGNN